MPNELGSVQIFRGNLVLTDRIVPDGVIVATHGIIQYIGPYRQLPTRYGSMGGTKTGHYILPGLVDIHCHGGGGGSFPDARSSADAMRAVMEHRRHGTTTLVASLVSQPIARLLELRDLLAPLIESDELAGIHYEGPFISQVRCGAHNPSDIITPDTTLASELTRVPRTAVTMTLAPEIPGNIGPQSVTSTIIDHGVIPSYGHTDATGGVMRRAIEYAVELLQDAPTPSKLPTITHLFNAMRPFQHREAGPIFDALSAAARGQAVIELVADGIHLASEIVAETFDIVGAHHIMLITDAMAAAGMADGHYQLGPLAVSVDEGVARLENHDGTPGAIAGGTAHLIDVVRTTVAAGVPLVSAVAAASSTPARVLGRNDIGQLAPGRRADLVITNEDLNVSEVYRAGWAVPATR